MAANGHQHQTSSMNSSPALEDGESQIHSLGGGGGGLGPSVAAGEFEIW